MTDWKQLPAQLLSPWIYGPAAVAGWLIFGLVLKRLVLGRMKAFAKRTPLRLDDFLVDSLNTPLGVVILAVALMLSAKLLPVSEELAKTLALSFQVLLVLAMMLFAERLLSGFLIAYSNKIQVALSPTVLKGLIRGAIFGLGALVLLDMIGVSITPLLASLGIGSLSVGLALQETLTNFFSGVHVSLDRPIAVGDFVRLESGEEGYVTEIGWRSTRIRTLPNNMIVVPNQKLTSSIITNYYLPDREVAVLVEASVHYASDLAKVERVTIEVGRHIMKTVQGGVANFEPFIRFHTFDSSSINFTVILRAREFADQYLIKHEFIKALQKRYGEEEIVIPYPLRTLDIPPETVQALKQVAGLRS
jgi:small-conductance mechanosensitive channel